MLSNGFKQILVKTSIFLVFFISISFFLGQKIVSSALLYKFYIFIYGGMGYILLFSILGFILLYREKLIKIKSFKNKLTDYFFIFISLVLAIFFYFLALNIEKIPINLFSILLIHALFLSIFFFLLIGVYSFNLIREFFISFKKELSYFLIFGILAYSLMRVVWQFWPYLSNIVLRIVYLMLSAIGIEVKIIGISNDILKVNDFAVIIGEACSGVYSIFLFVALFIFMVLVDWNKIDKLKVILIFLPAILGAFFVNILRVFSLMLVGAFISREIAEGLYHSYVGMIFFLIYFAIFIILFYDWMKKPEFQKKQNFRKFYKKTMSDSLYSNSIFLMLSTLVMSILGFIFWIVATKIYSAKSIGVATTLISVGSLIASISLLGLNVGLIRFLPSAENKNKKINTALTLSSLVAIVITTLFLLMLKFLSPSLYFIKENIILSFVFIIFMIFASISSIIESVFIAYRDAKFVFLKNTIFSALKIVLLPLFVSFAAFGLFSSWMLSLISSLIILIIILIYKYDYKPQIVFYDYVIKKIGKYSFGNYVSGIFGTLPILLLPLIITNLINPETTAYYYVSMMIASLLFAVPQSVSNSLFTEGSYEEKNLIFQIKKSIKITYLILIPGIIFLFLFGKYILLMFGKSYSLEGYAFLNILAISGIFVAANSIYSAIFKVKKRVKEIIAINAFTSIIIFGLSFFFIAKGLVGIGYAWLIGHLIISVLYIITFKNKTQLNER